MKARWTGLALALVLTACAAGVGAMKIQSEHEPGALPNLARYRTYGWLPGSGGPDPRVALVAPQVRLAVEDTLRAKGFQKAADIPDFLVGWHALVEGKRQVSTIEPFSPAGQPGARLPGGPIQRQTMTLVREYEEGTLVLEFLDGRTGKLVWRGWAQAEVKASVDPPEREARIGQAIRGILDTFPPKQ